MTRFINWLKRKFGEDTEANETLRRSGVHVVPTVPKVRKRRSAGRVPSPGRTDKVAVGKAGANVLIRNKYVREDTGTHETLKIVDDSLLESEEEFGDDPYNTGRFDRAKTWESFRK